MEFCIFFSFLLSVLYFSLFFQSVYNSTQSHKYSSLKKNFNSNFFSISSIKKFERNSFFFIHKRFFTMLYRLLYSFSIFHLYLIGSFLQRLLKQSNNRSQLREENINTLSFNNCGKIKDIRGRVMRVYEGG